MVGVGVCQSGTRSEQSDTTEPGVALPPTAVDLHSTASADGVSGPRRERWPRWVGYLAGTLAWLLIALVQFSRIPAQARDVLYAEDGQYFLADWINRPGIGLLFEPYAGYQHFVPRVLSGAVRWIFPAPLWGLALTFSACAVVSGIALTVYAIARSRRLSIPVSVAVAAIPVLLPLARLEAIGSVANLHWYFGYLMFWLLLFVPRTRLQAVAAGTAAAVAVLTEPQAMFLLPLVLVVVFRHRRASIPVVAGWVVGCVVQGLTVASFLGIRPYSFDDERSAFYGYLVNVVGTDISMRGTRLSTAVATFGWLGLSLMTVLVLCAVAAAAVLARDLDLRVVIVGGLAGSVVLWCASYFMNDHSMFRYAALVPGEVAFPLVRWGMTAAMLLLAACVVALQVAADRWPRARPVVGVALAAGVVVLALAAWRGDSTRVGPDWSDGVHEAEVSCDAGAGAVQVAAAPAGWSVRLPCTALPHTG